VSTGLKQAESPPEGGLQGEDQNNKGCGQKSEVRAEASPKKRKKGKAIEQ